ncbi:hypothetical protein ACJ41O_014397 [Fusarium nematophilum]
MAESEPKAQPRLDALGIFWIVFTFAWTFMVAGGMYFLWRRRDMPLLRIRGLPLSFAAIFLLHLYWGAVQTGYVYFPLATPEVEYWIMSTWLPFGIALFHASNSRFLHVAKTQKELFAMDAPPSKGRRSGPKGLKGRFQSLDYTKKILVLVGAGMAFQLFLTIFMFLISRKFHPSFGIPDGPRLGMVAVRLLAVLLGVDRRPLHPVEGPRHQRYPGMAGSDHCLLHYSLHATPMWLIALYVPAMSTVNNVFVPPQWIALSIMMLEIFTVFLPCWEVIQHQTLRQETLDSIAQWQLNKKAVEKGARSIATGSTTVAGSGVTAWSKDGSVKSSGSGESILTMEALEYVLERNPEPLQQFSALRDFSGENIAFLRAVAEWKSSLPPDVRDPEKIKDAAVQELVRERFNSALRIYTDFVSSRDAEFQINLSSQDLRKLEAVFENSARALYGEKRQVDPATPFDSFAMTSTRVRPSSGSAHGSETGIMNAESVNNDTDHISDKALYWGDIPEGFDAAVFDDAEGSIKYLVLTNTWPKFVKDRRCSIDSDTLEAGNGIAAAR